MSTPARVDDVLVVGGGVIGLAIAEAVACEGPRVRLIESDAIGSGASGAAAGMLAPISEAEAPGPMLRLGLESLARFEPLCARLAAETGIDPELDACGILQLARSEAQAEAQRARATRMATVELEWVDDQSLRQRHAALARDFVGGLYSPCEAHLRPPLLVAALAAAARARGVVIETGVRALGLRRAGSRIVGIDSNLGPRDADQIVLAAGPWTPSLLAASAIDLPGGRALAVAPLRGQIIRLEPPLPLLREMVWHDDRYIVPKRDGSWIVGATQEVVGFDRRVTAAGIEDLLAGARAIFPDVAEAGFGRAWAGLRPASGDGLPFLGPVPEVSGLHLAAGHGRNGVLLAPITAELVRDGLLGKGGVAPGDATFVARQVVAEGSKSSTALPSR